MQEVNYKEIELFIKEELSQHGEWLVDRFIEALEKNGNVDTGQLVESFDYDTSKGSDGSLSLVVSFNTYGRLMEVAGRRRRQRLKENRNRDTWGKKNHRPKKVQWYNKNRYAGYGRLIRRLAAGMSDDELRRIRGILQRAKQELSGAS